MYVASGSEYRFGAALLASLILHAAAAMTLSLPAPLVPSFEVPVRLQLQLAELRPTPAPQEEAELAPAAPDVNPAPVAPNANPSPRVKKPRPRLRSTPGLVRAPEPPARELVTVPEEMTEQAGPPISERAAPATESPPVPPMAYAPPAAAPPPEPVAELLTGYGKIISQTLARHKEYPRIAQMRGWEGAVTMELRVSPSGGMLEAKLHRSSGYPVLDEEALAMAARVQQFPTPPAGLRHGEIAVLIPVVFRLTP